MMLNLLYADLHVEKISNLTLLLSNVSVLEDIKTSMELVESALPTLSTTNSNKDVTASTDTPSAQECVSLKLDLLLPFLVFPMLLDHVLMRTLISLKDNAFVEQLIILLTEFVSNAQMDSSSMLLSQSAESHAMLMKSTT